MITKSINEDSLKDIEYIGILRSGSFLAHTLNILKQSVSNSCNCSCNWKVASLLTHPYLTILPRTISYRENTKCKRFIYIDEAIKSGYSLSIADIYRKKILTLSGISKCENDMAFSIADMVNYKPKTSTIKSKSLLDVVIKGDENKKLVFESANKTYSTNKSFDWYNFLNDLDSEIYDETNIDNYKSLKKLQDEIKNLAAEKNVDRLDVTNVISNSFLLFRSAKYLVHKFVKSNIFDKKQLFYSGSQEGRLLTDAMIFIGKILYPKYFEKEIYINAKTITEYKENSFLIFVDMTVDSGYTAKNVFKLDVNKKLEREKFDMILTILDFNRTDVDDNIISIDSI
jgi:hypothetical protein